MNFHKFFLLLPVLASSLYASSSESGFTAPDDWWRQTYGEPQPGLSLYRNPENKYIQEFNATVRLQYQGAYVLANEGVYPGSHHFTSEWRRFRLGANMKILDYFRLNNIWNIGGVETRGYAKNGIWHDHGVSTGNIYDASLTYSPGSCFSATIGKYYPLFFAENRVSSADYRTPEVPMLEAQFLSNSSFGVRLNNDEAKNDFGWQANVWSNTEERSRGTWGTWQSVTFMGGVSYKADKFILDKGRVFFDWIHSMQDMDAMAHARFRDTYSSTSARDVFALHYRGTEGSAELILEALWGNTLASYAKNGQLIKPDNVFGLVAMPMYMLGEHIQLVTRLQWSKGRNAVKLPARYTSIATTDGAYVDEIYGMGAGLNIYPYPQNHPRLRISFFAEYCNSNRRSGTGGFTGWTFISGIYTNF